MFVPHPWDGILMCAADVHITGRSKPLFSILNWIENRERSERGFDNLYLFMVQSFPCLSRIIMSYPHFTFVIPAKAGIHIIISVMPWCPCYVGWRIPQGSIVENPVVDPES